MPQVPYQPYSTAQPSSPGERISVNTPPAAFGENIGAALKQLGTSFDQVGSELFQRAVGFQDIKNETEAREADAKYAEQQGLLHADYTAKEGKAAVDGLKPYIDQSHQLRQSIRDNLSNPAAQRMYDSASLGFLQRNIFNAAGHAGNENKRWVVGTAQAKADLAAKTMVNPTDEEEAEQKVQDIDDQSHVIAGAQNWEEPQRQDWKLKQTSHFRLGQIGEVSKTDPPHAFQMLDKYKEQMTQDDFDHVSDIVRAQNRAIGGAILANNIFDPSKSLKDMEADVEKQAPKYAHDDPLFAQHAIQTLRGVYNQKHYAQKQEDMTNLQTVDEAIGKGVKDERELRLDPQVAAAIDALPANKRNKIPAAINNFNAARLKSAHEDNFTQLWGMSYNDPSSFLDLDISAQNVSQQQMRQLMNRKATLIKNPQDDPRVARAVGWMRASRGSELEALGIFHRNENNKDQFDHFTGALSSAIDVWQEENKRPPGYKDIVETIGPQVIKQRAGTHFWSANRPFFDQDVPKGWGDDLKAEAERRGEPAPTDEEINRAFVRSQFIQLYHKEKPSGAQ